MVQQKQAPVRYTKGLADIKLKSIVDSIKWLPKSLVCVTRCIINTVIHACAHERVCLAQYSNRYFVSIQRKLAGDSKLLLFNRLEYNGPFWDPPPPAQDKQRQKRLETK